MTVAVMTNLHLIKNMGQSHGSTSHATSTMESAPDSTSTGKLFLRTRILDCLQVKQTEDSCRCGNDRCGNDKFAFKRWTAEAAIEVGTQALHQCWEAPGYFHRTHTLNL